LWCGVLTAVTNSTVWADRGLGATVDGVVPSSWRRINERCLVRARMEDHCDRTFAGNISCDVNVAVVHMIGRDKRFRAFRAINNVVAVGEELIEILPRRAAILIFCKDPLTDKPLWRRRHGRRGKQRLRAYHRSRNRDRSADGDPA